MAGVVGGGGVVAGCSMVHRSHLGHHHRSSDLVESTMVRSSMHLMRVHNGRSVVDHRGCVMDHRGSMMDHRGSMMDHRGSVVDHMGRVMDHGG